MKYLSSTLLLLGACLLVSCGNSKSVRPDSYSAETQRFNTYLQKQFSKSIPTDSARYVLISSTGCGGCIKSFLNTIAATSINNGTHYIISEKLLARQGMEPEAFNSSVMIDEENQVDRMPYHKGNIGIVETTYGKIYNYYNVEPYQTDSVLMLISK